MIQNKQNRAEIFGGIFHSAVLAFFKAVYFFFDKPWILFLSALLAFIFCPPDSEIIPFDRIAFLLLIQTVLIFVLKNRTFSHFKSPLIFPMAGLISLALASGFRSTHNLQTWSLFANTFVVPFAMFFLAKAVWREDRLIKYFLAFSAVVGVYLVFSSTAFLFDLKFLIYPYYAIDPSKSDPAFVNRACGPFLNPVANGTAMIVLSLLSLHWFMKTHSTSVRLVNVILLVFLPFGILATMTRSVWLAFLVSVIFWVTTNRSARIKKWGFVWIVLSSIVIGSAISSPMMSNFVSQRIQDRENVSFRLNLYSAAFEMFKRKPLIGWGMNVFPIEVHRYLPSYEGEATPHNTYLNVLVEQGILGFVLFASIIVYLFKIGKKIISYEKIIEKEIIDRNFVMVYRNILVVYLINGMFVIMNYQFTNAIIFTLAGMVSAKEEMLLNLSNEPSEGLGYFSRDNEMISKKNIEFIDA